MKVQRIDGNNSMDKDLTSRRDQVTTFGVTIIHGVTSITCPPP